MSVTFWAPFLFKGDQARFLTLQGCFTNKTKTKTNKKTKQNRGKCCFVQRPSFPIIDPVFQNSVYLVIFFSFSHLTLHLKFQAMSRKYIGVQAKLCSLLTSIESLIPLKLGLALLGLHFCFFFFCSFASFFFCRGVSFIFYFLFNNIQL